MKGESITAKCRLIPRFYSDFYYKIISVYVINICKLDLQLALIALFL